MRASRRPRNSSTTRRATCVESDPLGRRVEGADVQRARVAQRGARGARRERLVDVAEVERRARERLLDRARDVDRHRRARAGGRARRQHLADAEHAVGLPGGRPAAPRAARAPRGSPGATRGRARSRCDGRDHDHAVPARRQLLGAARDRAVDLVRRLPGERGDLGDREALGHDGEDSPARGPVGAPGGEQQRRARTRPTRQPAPAHRQAQCRAARRTSAMNVVGRLARLVVRTLVRAATS